MDVMQSCPLCGMQAEFSFLDHKERKAFRCDRCVRFVVTVDAERRLSNAVAEFREGLSKQAREAPEGYVLVIEAPMQIDAEGLARPAVEHRYVKRSELPR